MSENIQSISQGTYTIGQTSATNFIAGPGVRIDEPSAGTVRIGNDETVLWSGDIGYNQSTTGISEALTNFERLRIYNKAGAYNEMSSNWLNNVYVFFSCTYDTDSNYGKLSFVGLTMLDSGTTLKETYNRINQGTSYYNNVNDDGTHIVKVVGINRISGNA